MHGHRICIAIQVLQLLNTICCQHFERICSQMNRNINSAVQFANLYKTYIFLFDDLNMERLRAVAREAGVDAFNLSEVH
ncbi:hypothetical protein Sjap_001441 [Stephania japonica]|uniref:Uncharacterized protein n=1 Tax=Stephania japonica TaxID=461633 RepID=A0AAP0KK23_9MAGN